MTTLDLLRIISNPSSRSLGMTLSHMDFRQGRAASNLEEVNMIRYDFDVVSDPLPAKPIVPPAAEAQAVRQRREGTSKSGPGKAGASGTAEDVEAGRPPV